MGLAAVATIVAGAKGFKIMKAKALADDKELMAYLEGLTVDEFKKVGKFEKGKAFIDGKPYNGILTTVNKKGETIDMYYQDGKIRRAWGRELPNGNRASKTYTYKNGNLKEIQIFDGTPRHGKYVTIKDNVITKGELNGSTVQKSIRP